MTGPRPLDSILQITPYKGGDPAVGGFKLSSNENPLGCSPKAVEAVREAASNMELYPDGSALKLREAIAGVYGLEANRIVCGTGSDEIFQLLGRGFLRPGDEILQTEHAFLVYRLVAMQSGATVVSAPERDYTADVDAMIERISPKTRIVFLANPNNPTGTYIPFSEVERLHAALPDDVLLVYDGAYAEYMDQADYDDGADLAATAANVIMTRTFSKVHGLAALRLGWAYGPEAVIDALHRVRGPFNVNAIAQAAGLAAITDTDFIKRSVAHNATELKRVYEGLTALGYNVTPGTCNFLLVHFGEDPATGSKAADAFLRQRGIVVRNVDAYGLPGALRISIGTEAANTAVLDALADFKRA